METNNSVGNESSEDEMNQPKKYFDPYDIYDNYNSTETTALIDNVQGNELFDELRPIGNRKFLSLLVIPPALGGFLFGYDIGGTASCITPGAFKGNNLAETFGLSEFMLEMITAESMVGAVLGSIFVFWLGDYLSRRGVLIMAAGFYGGGALIEGAAPNVLTLFIGRTAYGIGIGMSMHSTPLYISEITPAKLRGFYSSVREFFLLLGIIFGYFGGLIFFNVDEGWRYIYLFAIIPSMICGIGMYFVYPSPRWLVLKALKNDHRLCVRDTYLDEAHTALSKIRRLPLDVVQFELNEIVDNLSSQLKEQFSFWDFFKDKVLTRALFIASFVVIFQQITGQTAFLYYSTQIFEGEGLEGKSLVYLSIGIGIIKIVLTTISIFLVDRMGRRILLIIGISIMVFSLLILSAFSFLAVHLTQFQNVITIIIVTGSFLYVSGYQIGFGAITWTLIGEIFPLKSRSQAVSVAVLLNFLSNYFVVLTYLSLISWISSAGTYLLYLLMTSLSLVFVFLFLPETKSKTLEQLERYFRSSILSINL